MMGQLAKAQRDGWQKENHGQNGNRRYDSNKKQAGDWGQQARDNQQYANKAAELGQQQKKQRFNKKGSDDDSSGEQTQEYAFYFVNPKEMFKDQASYNYVQDNLDGEGMLTFTYPGCDEPTRSETLMMLRNQESASAFAAVDMANEVTVIELRNRGPTGPEIHWAHHSSNAWRAD